MSNLIPADHKRCQTDMPSGYSFMTLGGRPGDMIRCNNEPAVIVTENKPGKDGKIGSMSLCADHINQFLKQVPADSIIFSEVE